MLKKGITVLYLYAFTVSVISVSGCEVNNPDSASIKLISFKDNGCHSQGSKIEDDVILNWDYAFGKLKLEFLFSTHCSASCKDSVLVEDNTINVCLADTSHMVARCICPLKEEFEFDIAVYEEVQILFNYKSANSTEYSQLLSRTIEL